MTAHIRKTKIESHTIALLQAWTSTDMSQICTSSDEDQICTNPFTKAIEGKMQGNSNGGTPVTFDVCAKCCKDWKGMRSVANNHKRYKKNAIVCHKSWKSRVSTVQNILWKDPTQTMCLQTCYLCKHGRKVESNSRQMVAPLLIERVCTPQSLSQFKDLLRKKFSVTVEECELLIEKRSKTKVCNTHWNIIKWIIYGLDPVLSKSCSITGCPWKLNKKILRVYKNLEIQMKEMVWTRTFSHTLMESSS